MTGTCQWVTGIRFVACLVVVLGFTCSAAPAEEVDVWLEDRGLTRLLVQHLENRLPGLGVEARSQATIRLARLYAELLGATEDRAERIILEERSRALLDEVTGSAAQALRLELCQGAYLGIEQDGERHRLRLLSKAEKDRTIERIERLISELDELHDGVARAVERSKRVANKRTSSRGSGRSKLATLEEMISRIDFLSGWCRYYLSWLTGAVSHAELAEQHFAAVLSLDEFTPEDVSHDLRASPAIAWTIIGMAMANSQTSSEVTALRWLDLLDVPIVPVEIREQLPGWRLALLLEHGQFEDALRLLEATAYLQQGRTIAWIRMAAVHGLEHAGDPAADALAATALAELATLGELGHVQDIVGRYGDAVGGDSFPFSYARAIIDYRAARELEEQVPEADQVDRRHAWRVALKAIDQALAAPDADRFESTRQQAGLLRAWAIYSLDRFEEARDLFEQTADFLPEQDASEAIWMAYVSEERRFALDASVTTAILDRLVDLYLERFPSGPRAGELMVRRASRGEDASRERVDELLRVPLDSPSRPLAQMRASDMLYRLFREAAGSERQSIADEYLVLAVPMMQEDWDSGDSVAGSRSVARARRILEIATDPHVLRLVAADSALLILFNRDTVVSVVDEDLENEVDYRRILLAMARDEVADAQAIVDILYDRQADSIWSRLATRRALERARQDRDLGDGDSVRFALRRIVKNGNRLLAESPTLEVALQSRSNLAVAASVALSAAELSTGHGDLDAGERAWELYGALLEVAPRNRIFLAGRGRLAAVRKEWDEALRCWRIIATGSRTGSDDWFDARTELVEILEKTDPDRAREVLQQHHALYPEYGPSPWGRQLWDAAIRLGVAGGTEPPGGDEMGDS